MGLNISTGKLVWSSTPLRQIPTNIYVPSEEEETEDEGFLEDGDDDPTLPSHYIDLEPPPAIDIATICPMTNFVNSRKFIYLMGKCIWAYVNQAIIFLYKLSKLKMIVFL